MRKLWLATLSILILGLMTAVATTGSLAQKTAVAPAGQEQAVMVSKDMPAKLQKAIKQSLADAKFADKTQKALAQGVAKRGQTPGFLGIPGAPAAHYVWGLLWAIWVGWIFSTVGRLRRHHGRGGAHHHLRPGRLRQELRQGQPGQQAGHRLHPGVQPVAGGACRP